MDTTRFPEEIGELANKTFSEACEDCPKIIEFVDSLWEPSKTTGIFKLFLVYVKNQLDIPDMRAAHEKRCNQFVLGKKKLPNYMRRYIRDSKINTI